MKKEKLSYFNRFCPNCGHKISDIRLINELVCENCLKSINTLNLDKIRGKVEKENIIKPIWYYLYDKIENKSNIINLKNFFDEVDEYMIFFKNITNKTPWSLQLTWSKRVIMQQSFSIIAPTGVGKTTWGLVTGLYLWKVKNISKIYFILPTSLLVQHTFERFKDLINNYCKIFGVSEDDILEKILIYHGKLKNKEKKEVKDRIKSGDFDILFSTTNFLYKDFDILENNIGKFKFIFVDDVDSLLKSAKNIDYVLKLLGYPQEIIDLALKLVYLKIKLLNAKGSYFDKLNQEIKEIKNKIDSFKENQKGILVASSATAKPKGMKIKILRELLNFEVGRSSTNLRNIEDLYIDGLNLDLSLEKEKRFENILNFYDEKLTTLINILKTGILFFISSDLGKDFVDEFVNYLNKKGLKAVSYENLSDEVIEEFRNGNINALVGIASWRNPLARGLDLPDAAKYAIFLGVPKFVFNVDLLNNPKALISVILNIGRILDEDLKEQFEWERKTINYLKYLNKISNYSIEYIQKNEEISKKLHEIYTYLDTILKNEKVKKLLIDSDDIVFDGERFIVSDVTAYIQASGRTSRIYVGGLTKGLSIILVDNNKSFNNLRKRIKWFYDEIEFKKLEI